jgi:hypothetical protein
MAIEERLIDADILVGTNAFALDIQLHHTVHKQERVAMRQVFANFCDVHHFEGKPVVKIGSARRTRSIPLHIKDVAYRLIAPDMKKVSAI